ncbi:hypothetical protein [Roseivirga seohaensis]|uniref:hypothetical protein n=1 Tax=Roseivirga seohaensis TaxID=1914963 RepID=UPI003BA91939
MSNRKIKTLKGWKKSNLNLDDYLPEPCEIDEELSLYIGECVPAKYLGFENKLTQGGDCEKEEEAEDGDPIGYYMTTSFVNGKNFYLGILPEFRQ